MVAFTDTKQSSWPMTLGSFTQSTGCMSTMVFSSMKSYSARVPRAKVATILLGRRRLRVPLSTPDSTSGMTPSLSSSVWSPRSR